MVNFWLFVTHTSVCILASKHHGQTDGVTRYAAAATVTTANPGSVGAYEELNMTSRIQHVYTVLTR